MKRDIGALAVTVTLLLWYSAGDPAFAQKQSGILRVPHFDSPASMSLHEESTIAANRPLMGVFNNLVMFDQHVAQNSPRSIVPDLATSWSWNEEGTELTLPLRQGVRWHDGKPFTARVVKCTWDLLVAKSSERLRIDPGKGWYDNLDEVTANSDFEVTFHLKRAQPSFLARLASGWSAVYPCHTHAREMRQHPIATGPFKLPCRHEIFHFHLERPQPAFVALLASGYSVVYPCHVPPNEMRQHPIGTGPFKFVEFRPNERITLTRNRDYWKSDRPYLDGIEFTIIRDVSTAHLAFVAGKLDWIATSIPLLKDVRSQAPDAICEVLPGGISRNLIFNRDAPPFDNADMRRAMALALDRKAFIDIISDGEGDIGGVMQPLPEGVWGMPPEVLNTLPGYDPDVQQNRSEAREIMHKLGYGPDKRLALKVSTRNIPPFRDPAVILTDQLKEVFIDGELDIVETALWYPKMYRKDYKIGLNLTGGVDDPGQQLYENYGCGSPRNYTGYCNPELEKLFDRQSVEADEGKRKQLVWEIERKLAEDGARPIIFYNRFAYCWQPQVKDWTMMINSIINNWRMEDVRLDK